MTPILEAIREARSMGLTRAQVRYLRALRAETADGLPATHRAISRRLGVQVGAVYQMLTRLRRDGLVTFRPGEARTIRLTETGAAAAVIRVTQTGPRGVIRSSVPCDAS